MREWLIALGILVVVALLLDGLRRMRNARRDSLQISLAMQRGLARQDDDYGNDFPSGPARVVAQRGEDEEDDREQEECLPEAMTDTGRRRQIDFAQSAPLLLDVRDEERPARIEPGFGDDDESLDDAAHDQDDDEDPQELPPPRGVKNASPVFDTATTPLGLGESEVIGKPRVYERPADKAPPRREPPAVKPVKPVIKAKEERAQRTAQPAEPKSQQQLPLYDYIAISVMARDRSGFPGAALLETLLSQGLRYGHRNIFHRYIGDESEQESLYSVANAVKPGTFDLNSMESFQTPGITLLLPLNLPERSMEAFESMLATATAVADQLNGELRDEHRSVMTNQTIEHCRQRIRDFEMQSRLRAR